MNKKNAILITLPFQRDKYDSTQPWFQIVNVLLNDYQIFIGKDVNFPEISIKLPESVNTLDNGEIKACDSTQRWDQGLTYIQKNFPHIERYVHIAGDLSPDIDVKKMTEDILSKDSDIIIGDYIVPNNPPNSKYILGEFARTVFLKLFDELLSSNNINTENALKIIQVRSEYFSIKKECFINRQKDWELRWLPWTATLQNIVWALKNNIGLSRVELGEVSDTLAKSGVPQRTSQIGDSFQIDRISFVASHTYSWLYKDNPDNWERWIDINSILLNLRQSTYKKLKDLEHNAV